MYHFINSILELLSKLNSLNTVNKDDILQLNNLCLKYNKNNLTSKEIDIFINNFAKINTNILNLFYGNNDDFVLELMDKYKIIMSKLHPDKNDTDTTKLAQMVSEAKETILKNDFN